MPDTTERDRPGLVLWDDVDDEDDDDDKYGAFGVSEGRAR